MIDNISEPRERKGQEPSNRYLVRLLHRVATADRRALARLYDVFADEVAILAREKLTSPHDVTAVVSATFLEVWSFAALHDGRLVDVRGWLQGIARARTVDRLRMTILAGSPRHEPVIRPLTSLTSAYDDAVESVLLGLIDRIGPRQPGH